MARRKAGAVPQLQHHKGTGQGKVQLGGRDFCCGTWGTPECKAKYDRLIAEWLHNGRRLPARPLPVASQAQPLTTTDPVVEVRVGPSSVRVQEVEPPAPGGLLLCEIDTLPKS